MAKKVPKPTTDGKRFIAGPGIVLTGNEAVRYRLERLVKANPEITASDAARGLGVSRQRIREVLGSIRPAGGT